MRNICIFSNDILFARMLRHHFELLRIPESFEVHLNNEGIAYNGNPKNIIILDLDSSYADNVFPVSEIIGFFSSRDSYSKSARLECKGLLRRPFRLSDLSDMLSEIISDAPCRDERDAESVKVNQGIIFSDRDSSINFRDCKIHLSKNEYDILHLLAQRREEAVTREEINTVLGADSGNICDVYICKLRAKLATASNEKVIFTLRNRGYMLKLK